MNHNYALVLDTETTSADKLFCYDIGWCIMDMDTQEIVKRRSYVIEQVWHNEMLFSTAYFTDKRSKYVSAMRGKSTKLRKWGHAMQALAHDIKEYDIKSVYAYNCNFDDRVLTFNCDWYHTMNPLDSIQVLDIRAYAMTFVCDNDYKVYCDEHQHYTKSGNYSTTAEDLYRYLIGQADFEEAHMALNDAEIESFILYAACDNGAELDTVYPCPKSLPRKERKPLTIKVNNEVIYSGTFTDKFIREKDGRYYFKGCEED